MIYDDSIKRIARVVKMADAIIFDMPPDQDWPADLWERIGIGPEWEQFYLDLNAAGGTIEDTEDIVIECLPENRHRIMKVVMGAQAGKYGPDVQAYWGAAKIHRRR